MHNASVQLLCKVLPRTLNLSIVLFSSSKRDLQDQKTLLNCSNPDFVGTQKTVDDGLPNLC